MEVWRKRSFRKLTLHSKVVITVTGFLIVIGTIGLKLTEDITWLGAFFHSVSARTAGFSTYPLGTFTNAGLFILVILMVHRCFPGLYRRRYQDEHHLRDLQRDPPHHEERALCGIQAPHRR